MIHFFDSSEIQILLFLFHHRRHELMNPAVSRSLRHMQAEACGHNLSHSKHTRKSSQTHAKWLSSAEGRKPEPVLPSCGRSANNRVCPTSRVAKRAKLMPGATLNGSGFSSSSLLALHYLRAFGFVVCCCGTGVVSEDHFCSPLTRSNVGDGASYPALLTFCGNLEKWAEVLSNQKKWWDGHYG